MQFWRTPEATERGISVKVPRSGDAGFDLPSLDEVTIAPGRSALLRTGIHFAIPDGYVGLVRDRSSTALRGAMCGAGVIDASYRGELKVLLYNFGTEPLHFGVGERVAQLVVVQHLTGESLAECPSLEHLGETDRGGAGFGSTGR